LGHEIEKKKKKKRKRERFSSATKVEWVEMKPHHPDLARTVNVP
jgi:hypothetical protein